MNLLAIDPGLRATGLVALETEGCEIIYALTLRPPKSRANARARVSWIVEEVGKIMEAECPLVLAVEEGYVPHYKATRPQLPPALAAQVGHVPRDDSSRDEGRATSALKTAELRGRLVGLADGTDCEVIGVTANEAQRALTGDGRSLPRGERKAAMLSAARMQFSTVKWTQDSADALGVALAARRKLMAEALAEQAREGPSRHSRGLSGVGVGRERCPGAKRRA